MSYQGEQDYNRMREAEYLVDQEAALQAEHEAEERADNADRELHSHDGQEETTFEQRVARLRAAGCDVSAFEALI